MARISLIEPAQASPEVKEIYDSKFKGKPGNIQKALAHRPARRFALGLGRTQASVTTSAIHRISRSSPTRRVICSRSRYSSSGIAYLRLTPVISLKRATSICGRLVLSDAILWRRSVSVL